MVSYPGHLRKILAGILLTGLLSGCGPFVASGDGNSEDASAVYQDVTGVIKSDTGDATELAGWVLVFVERDSGIARTSVIDVLGNYRVSSLAVNRPQTIALLSTTYHLESVLAMIGAETDKVHQFFTVDGNTLPTMVHNGSIVQFVDSQNLSFTSDVASDTDGNGIPDGIDGTVHLRLHGKKLALAAAAASSASTGAAAGNYTSPDLDGDGLINVFDSDANGNGVLDIFDPDVDGDAMDDSAALIHYPGSQYFPEGLDWIAVQVFQQMEPQDAITTTLQIAAKTKPGFSPAAVRVEGASELLSNADVMTVNTTTGAQTRTSWDSTLATDSAATTGLYARTVALDGVKKPKANQLMFIVVDTNEDGVVLTRKYPFMFAAVTAGTITGSWNSATKSMTLGGTLFKNFATGTAITDFKWSLHLFSSDNVEVFASDPIPGTTTSFVVPSTYLESGATYSAYLAARSLAKIAGYPAWVLKSATIPVN